MEINKPKDENVETKRKLASIQVIKELKKINKRSELASILGWNVVVQLGRFKEGEKIIYIEIDSLLPMYQKWAKPWKKTDYKVKTTIIDSNLSQGAIFPLSILTEYYKKKNIPYNEENLKIGENLTKILNIVKYEDDDDLLPLSTYYIPGSISPSKLSFPDELIKRTDEPRIQSDI